MSARFVSFVAVLSAVLSGCACDTSANSCATERDCLTPAAPKCDLNQGICVACVLDEHCSEGFVCLNGACEPGCASEHDRCPTGVCKAGVGCVGCEIDSQCGAGMVCTNNSCVQGCSAQNPNCP